MSDWPRDIPFPGSPRVLSPFCSNSIAVAIGSLGAPAGATNWPVANRAFYVPVRITSPFTVDRVFWINGSVVGGNVDVGIYSFDGTRLISSGAIVQSGINVIQISNVANTLIGPGLYYLAVSLSSTTGRLSKSVPTQYQAVGLGMLEQDTANPLPAVATFAALSAAPHLALFGMLDGTVI